MISVLIPVKDDPRLDHLLAEVRSQRTALSEETEVVVVDASAGRLRLDEARHPDVRWVELCPPCSGRLSDPAPAERSLCGRSW